MNIASIQARMGASRLPGKVLKEIRGKPLLLWHVERLRRSRLLDEVVIATTTSPGDEPIVRFCRERRISFFRGPENDVLGRIAALIRERRPDVHIELFGDSPLTDVSILDGAVEFYLAHRGEFDCVCNSVKTTYPPGQEVVVYPGAVLLEADRLTSADDPLREHSSFNILRRPERFRIHNLEAPEPYRRPDIYLEVDTADDFELISRVIGHFTDLGKDYFSLEDILGFLRAHPELVRLNDQVPRRWKAFRQDA